MSEIGSSERFPETLNVVEQMRQDCHCPGGTQLVGSEFLDGLLPHEREITVAVYKLIRLERYIKHTRTITEVEKRL
jgi:hypothetical protein